jgi:hypothetical protein
VGGRSGADRSRTRSGPGRPGLVDLDDDPLGADPAAYAGQVRLDALGQRLRQLSPGAVVGQHLVSARLLDRRGQRPGPRHLHLERAPEVLRLLLELVEVLGQE